ncbi:MAG: hypothetical protein FWB71_03565 [Defluviitaleaceae bacterium]|nr:hypothetical protein [Defluviitaleaceae bacterium]
MTAKIMTLEEINLPEIMGDMPGGRKYEVSVENGVVTIKPYRYTLEEVQGMLKDSNFGTHTILEEKRLEKERDYGKEIHF